MTLSYHPHGCNQSNHLLQCGHISWHKQQAQAQSYQFLPWVCNSGTIVQSLSHGRLFATPWTAARQVYLSFTISWSLLKLTSIKPRMPSNHLTLCCPLLLLRKCRRQFFLREHAQAEASLEKNINTMQSPMQLLSPPQPGSQTLLPVFP